MSTGKFSTRFDSISGTESRIQQELTKLRNENEKLKATNEELKKENSELRKRVEDLELILLGESNTDINPKNNQQILLDYLAATHKNMTREKNGYRYENLHEFFALLSFMGPHHFGLLTTKLLFPTYKTVSKYKKQFLIEFGISECIFNGDLENVICIIQKFLPPDFDGKAVLQVDAAYVTPYIKVKEDGTVNGLLYTTQIDPGRAKELLENEKKFLEFVQDNISQVIQAEFGITYAPLDIEYEPFPIACIPSTSGKCSIEMRDKIENLVDDLNQYYPIIGIGTDGDNTYNYYSDNFMYNIIEDFDNFLNLNAAEIIGKYITYIHFSDPFHLVKRDRYRKVSLLAFFISPMVIDELRSVKYLEDLGIPPYILDNSRARKMEDELPKKLFNMQVIQKIMEKGDFHLLLSMLPSTLLMESLHSRDIDFQATIDYLLFGASIVMVYYLMQKSVIDKEHKNYAKNPSGFKLKMCFTNEWCQQYILTAIAIASLIITERDFDCGACSSHYQEHGFANVRRHSKQDNSHMRFIKSLKDILLENELCIKLGISEHTINSRSDSGKNICQEQPVIARPISWYLKLAKRLWRNVTRFPRRTVLSKIVDTRTKMTIDELKRTFETFSEKSRISISTKSTGMIKTSGLNNVALWSAMSQLDDLDDEYD